MAVMTTEVALPLREVFHLFQCSVCHRAPMFPPVHSCRLGHNVCSRCLHLINNHCNECNEPLCGRNLNLEEVLVSMFDEEKCQICPGETADWRAAAVATVEQVIAEECKAQMLLSGRTVKCPFPCDANVTASGLYRHFGFEHPAVMVGMLCKNTAYPVVIPGDLLAGHGARCVYILVVDIADGATSEEDRLTALKDMNAADLLSITGSMRCMLQRGKYLAMLSVRPLQSLGVATWVTALYDFSPVKYTLRYNNGPNCTSYQGQPCSLLSQDSPCDCLVLPVVSTLDPQDLKLTLIFHLDIPFPAGLATGDSPRTE